MTARSFNDDPVNCRASINLDEATGRMNLNGYSVQNQQQNGFFRKRSGGAPCTPKESQVTRSKVTEVVNLINLILHHNLRWGLIPKF